MFSSFFNVCGFKFGLVSFRLRSFLKQRKKAAQSKNKVKKMLLFKTNYKGGFIRVKHLSNLYWVFVQFPNGGSAQIHFRSRAQAFKFVSFLGVKTSKDQQQINLFN